MIPAESGPNIKRTAGFSRLDQPYPYRRHSVRTTAPHTQAQNRSRTGRHSSHSLENSYRKVGKVQVLARSVHGSMVNPSTIDSSLRNNDMPETLISALCTLLPPIIKHCTDSARAKSSTGRFSHELDRASLSARARTCVHFH